LITGSGIQALGVPLNSYAIVIIGRFIYSLGGENSVVVVSIFFDFI